MAFKARPGLFHPAFSSSIVSLYILITHPN